MRNLFPIGCNFFNFPKILQNPEEFLEVCERFEDVGLDVDELVDAKALVGLDHLFGESCEDDGFHFALQKVTSGLGDFCIFVVGRAENHDVGFSIERGFYAFLGGSEAVVVDNLIAGDTEEVGGEA